jgi:ferritin-like metal-binding protein YciE
MMQHGQALDDLFLHTLKDIYSAEQQIFRALPRQARAAKAAELREAIKTHRDQTQDQIERLEQIFEMLGVRRGGPDCEAMKGILEEGDETIEEFKGGPAIDAALIGAAQTVEHYEINRYTALCGWAEELDMPDIAGLLRQSLGEEKETDRLLTEIAEGGVNAAAQSKAAASGTTTGTTARTGRGNTGRSGGTASSTTATASPSAGSTARPGGNATKEAQAGTSGSAASAQTGVTSSKGAEAAKSRSTPGQTAKS